MIVLWDELRWGLCFFLRHLSSDRVLQPHIESITILGLRESIHHLSTRPWVVGLVLFYALSCCAVIKVSIGV
jgi:hypothetical protein